MFIENIKFTNYYKGQQTGHGNLTYKIAQELKEGGDIGLFILLFPKVFHNVFLLVGLTILGTFMNFDWLVIVHQVECPYFSTTYCNLSSFISLIPLDPMKVLVFLASNGLKYQPNMTS